VIRWELPVRTAIGTSLAIIATKSLVGFTGDLHQSHLIEWPFLLGFTAAACTGMFLGVALNKRVSVGALQKGFGWFVLVMAALILLVELGFVGIP
ncbi:MAG: TSUP family transporter, partial [Planctomycetales bacterium]